jgi:hypothetical protein
MAVKSSILNANNKSLIPESRQVNQENRKRPLHSDIVPPQCAVAAKPHKVIMVMFIGDYHPLINALSMSLYIREYPIFSEDRLRTNIALGAAFLSLLVDAVCTLLSKRTATRIEGRCRIMPL